MSRYLLLFVALLSLAACAGLSPQQQASALAAVEQMVATGVISREQADAMIQAITGDGWSQAIELVATGVLSVISSLTGVRLWRGSIVARKGEIPAVVVEAATPSGHPAPGSLTPMSPAAPQ